MSTENITPDNTIDQRKTKFDDYILWYDGTIECSTIEQLCSMILDNTKKLKIALDKSLIDSNEVKTFNKFHSDELLVIVKKTHNEYDSNFCKFNLPQEFMKIDIYKYTEQNILPCIVHDTLYEKRCFRLFSELEWFMKSELHQNIFKTLLYIIDTFKKQDIFWGVGRGSSCASYILYLIDLHLVDSVLYDIPMEEFFK